MARTTGGQDTFPKQCGHNVGPPVSDKADSLMEMVSRAFNIFPKFPKNSSCDVAMCISTAQVGKKTLPLGYAFGNVLPNFRTK